MLVPRAAGATSPPAGGTVSSPCRAGPPGCQGTMVVCQGARSEIGAGRTFAMDGRFQDRVALVTGAASGIGAATARRLAREGARVAVVDVNEAGAREVAGQIEAAGGIAMPVRADVAVAAEVAAMVDRAVGAWGRLDALHNNATVVESGPIERLTPEGW